MRVYKKKDELPEERAVREYLRGRDGITTRAAILIGKMKVALRRQAIKEAIEIFGDGKVQWDEERKCVTEA